MYKDKKIYIIKEIWEETKNGKIHINKENNKSIILVISRPKDNLCIVDIS